MPADEQSADFDFFQVLSFDGAPRQSGRSERHHIIQCPDWLNIIAFTEDERLIAVRQYRYGASQWTFELPGGIVDHRASELMDAKAELLEETGHRAPVWLSLGNYAPNPALQTNLCHGFMCFGALTEPAQPKDLNIEVELIRSAEFKSFYEEEFLHQALMVTSFQLAERALPAVPAAFAGLAREFFASI